MKIEEIRGKSAIELGAEFGAMKKELFDLRFKSASQSLPSPSRIRMLRRTIARMGTILRERELDLRGQKGEQVTAMNPTPARKDRRTLEGTVTSDQCTKTITVEVERTFKHPKYKKYVRKLARFHAHDEKDEAKKGDRVEIRSCRPLSATKRWLLVRIIDRAANVEALEAVAGLGDAGVLASKSGASAPQTSKEGAS